MEPVIETTIFYRTLMCKHIYCAVDVQVQGFHNNQKETLKSQLPYTVSTFLAYIYFLDTSTHS